MSIKTRIRRKAVNAVLRVQRIISARAIEKYFPKRYIDLIVDCDAGLSRAEAEGVVLRHRMQKHSPRDAYIELGNYLTNAGQHTLANELYREGLRLDPHYQSHSLYLQNLLLADESTRESLLKEYSQFDRQYFADTPPVRAHWPAPDPNKKLRIGYLCHFFYAGVSPNCLMPMIRNHDRERFEIFCYDDGETPAHVKDPRDRWLDIRGMSSRDVAQRIADDEIDILQELNGHCLISRFDALAHRPAPVQVNWYNLTGTTGQRTVDYVMSDRISIPDQDVPYFSEKVYRQDYFMGAVDLLSRQNIDIAPPPFEKNGYITFGCFGASHKISKHAVKLWASVLKANPGSRMIVKSGTFTYPSYRHAFLQLFRQQGVAEAQLVFEGWSPYQELLQRYSEVDIMLDTFPTTGGTTTFEALWHGVPIVTRKGERWSSRSGASVAHVLGLTELVAETDEEFARKATQLAQNPARLRELRNQLRARMAASTLVDMPQFTLDIERAYHAMWRAWCEERNKKAA